MIRILKVAILCGLSVAAIAFVLDLFQMSIDQGVILRGWTGYALLGFVSFLAIAILLPILISLEKNFPQLRHKNKR